jgi:hypothetical protein
MRSKLGLASIALLWALGCGLLWRELHAQREQLAELHHQLAAGRPADGPRCPPVAMAAQSHVLDSQLVDAVVRQVSQRLGDARPSVPAAEPPPPTADQVQALDQYRQVVDDVLARGRLNREQAMQMQRQIALVGPSPELDELRRRIIVAINTNRLVIEDPRSFMP